MFDLAFWFLSFLCVVAVVIAYKLIAMYRKMEG